MLRQTRDAPWRAMSEVRRLVILPSVRLMFVICGVAWGRRWRILGMPIIQRHRGSLIELGDGLELRSWYSANPLAPNHPVVLATRSAGAVMIIGQNCGLTGATLVASERVEIGDHVLVGANSTIVDTDLHPLDPQRRRRDILW